jgi:hypothetical protein
MEIAMTEPGQLPDGAERVRVRPPLDLWLTYREAALYLVRSPKTVMNCVYKHRLERRTFMDGRGRYRRWMTLLPPTTVRRAAVLLGRDFLLPPEP